MAVNGKPATNGWDGKWDSVGPQEPKPRQQRTAPSRPGPTVRQSSPKDRDQARREKTTGNRTRTTNRSKSREYHIHINKGGSGGGEGDGAAGQFSRQSPIGDAEFLSAGHIRAFAERGRKAMRQAAMDFSYAEQTLRLVLREVPPPPGQGRGQAIARAHRVARSLKRAANAAQAASAHSARTWPAFMREFAPELNTYGGPKPEARRNMNFGM